MTALIRLQRTDIARPGPVVQRRAPQTSLAAVGQGLQDAAAMFNAFEDEFNTAEAKAADAAFSDLIRTELYGDENGFMYSQSGDAVTRRDQTAERIESMYQSTLQKLNPMARVRAQSSLEARRQRALTSIDQHTAGARRTYLNDASDARVTSLINDAIYDPSLVTQSIQTSTQEIRDAGARNGDPQEVIDLRVEEATTKIHTGVIARLENANPIAALEYLYMNKEDMAATEVARLENILVPAAKRAQGRRAGAAAAMSGVSQDFMDATRRSESSGNLTAKNPRSSALGPYQFLDATWRDLMQKYPGLGLTVDGRTDAAQSERAMRAFTRDNAQVLATNGIEPTNGNLYAAHFLGAGNAVRVLQHDNGEYLRDILPAKVMEANPFLEGLSVQGFKVWAAKKGGGNGIGYREGAADISTLLEISDPVQREAALDEFNLRVGVQKAQRAAAQTAAMDAAFQMIEAGGNVDQLPLDVRQNIGMESMNSLRIYQGKLATGESIQTNDQIYVDLTMALADDPEGFAAQDPMLWRPYLSDSDFQMFVGKWRDLRAGTDAKVKNVSISTVRTYAKNVLKSAGIEDPEDVDAFESTVLRWANENKGAAADPVQMKEAIDRFLTPIVIDPSGLGNKQTGSLFQIDFEGDPLDPNDDITPEVLMGSTFKISGKRVQQDHMKMAAQSFEERHGYAPTVQQMIDLLIASGIY